MLPVNHSKRHDRTRRVSRTISLVPPDLIGTCSQRGSRFLCFLSDGRRNQQRRSKLISAAYRLDLVKKLGHLQSLSAEKTTERQLLPQMNDFSIQSVTFGILPFSTVNFADLFLQRRNNLTTIRLECFSAPVKHQSLSSVQVYSSDPCRHVKKKKTDLS